MTNVIPLTRPHNQLPDVVFLRFHGQDRHNFAVTIEDFRTRDVLMSGTLARVGRWLNHNRYRYATGSNAIWYRDYRNSRGEKR